MESYPLNLAHQQHRRAEAHLINNRYDEAMQCHHNAAELLLDAMKSTTSSIALESITLQHSYHLKQKDLIKTKKEQYARVKKAVDNLKSQGKDPFNLQNNDHSKLQVAIFRAINESDVLLNTLSNKTANEVGAVIVPIKATCVDDKKMEKSQQKVVEELHILGQNLHSLVEQLVFQVEVLKDENMTLKERVNYFEKERARYLNLPTPTGDQSHRNNFSVLNIATDGYTKESAPGAFVSSPNNLTNIVTLERLNQKTHFDLSALKDD